jgi:hypothetical protein
LSVLSLNGFRLRFIQQGGKASPMPGTRGRAREAHGRDDAARLHANDLHAIARMDRFFEAAVRALCEARFIHELQGVCRTGSATASCS